jgi:endonuclease/exonuclease/phosphatase family metal-dependent hydrolase
MTNLRIMTFNIRGARGPEDDGVNAWAKRADLNVQTILRHSPDIIGLQESQTGNLTTYETALPEYAYEQGPPTSNANPAKHEYLAILWRKDKFDYLDGGGFHLSRTPEQWSEDWDTACVRAAHWATFRHKETGRNLFFLNTHLDHVSKLARAEGSKLILQKLNALNPDNWPVIITGDFNANAWNPPEIQESPRLDACHQFFLRAGFKDTFLEAGQKDSPQANTYHGFLGQAYQPANSHQTFRIDWVLLKANESSLKTKSCAIIRDEAPPLYPSDHYPVVAELHFSM